MNKQPDNLGEHLLVAMSDTPDSLALIRTITGQVPGLVHKHVTLMHYMTPLYWEHGGGTSRQEIEAIRHEEERIWKEEHSHIALTHSYFDEAQFILQDAGIPKENIQKKITYEGDSIADAILKELREEYYTAVVIGAYHSGILTRLLNDSLADVIQRQAGAYVHVWAVDLEHQTEANGKAAPKTRVYELSTLGQSIWLDYVNRDLLNSVELWHMIHNDGLCGMTSNPTIFDKSITNSDTYDREIRELTREDRTASQIYDVLTVKDVQHAADIFRLTYNRLETRDGYVSLEVSPHLAHDTEGTITEARRLWKATARRNVMIKVPATREGIPAIRQLISDGVNVNVTLLFGLQRYREVIEAYIAGLEERAQRGDDLYHVASVASFFLSRIDVLVDPILEDKMARKDATGKHARQLHGQVAIASAKVAYQIYKEVFGSDRFQKLADHGAHSQRLLWASTSTKNPDYSDVKYVEALIGSDTVNTLPPETLDAFRDHGDPAPRLETSIDEAKSVLDTLKEVGIDLDAVTSRLEDEGVEKFTKSYDDLLDTLESRRAHILSQAIPEQTLDLGDYAVSVQERIDQAESDELSRNIWRKDARLWKQDAEDLEVIRNGLGWLHVAETMLNQVNDLTQFALEMRQAGFRQVVHMGMGGSSLAPLVFQRTFEPAQTGLPLTVLDTTDPATIHQIEKDVPLANTLFIVASKSGTTAEPNAFANYFYTQVKAIKGDHAGENFVAITDPETPLANLAEKRGFRRIFENFEDIGGRYSALSYFGMVPAALMGLDIKTLLQRAVKMGERCAGSVPALENPGLVLGAVMGELALHRRNKVTFLMPEAIAALGMWLEQLLAESTGKEVKGLLPVAGEAVGSPDAYGDDRLFVHFQIKDVDDPALDKAVATLRDHGQPVVTIQMNDRLDMGGEFFKWEFATAVAGTILSIDAFDQPNVQESKDNTNQLLSQVRKNGKLPEQKPALESDGLAVYTTEAGSTLGETLGTFLNNAQPGDYVAVMAYLTENAATETSLQKLRLQLRDGLHVATTVGYGPRFLHSTGQYHKGGPDTGLFLQLTADDTKDVDVPDEPYTFGVFKQAQALGDLQALQRHDRRVIRVHLGKDVRKGLDTLRSLVTSALTEYSHA